ncbi:hypothetical protein MASR1M32_40630 [Rhodobacter sp.]
MRQALLPAERILLAMILTLGLATVLLAAALGRRVDWLGFLPGIGAAFGMVALGGYARGVRKAPRLGTAAIGIGIFMGFTALSAIFIFALFPLSNPLIDQRLIAMDAALGYDWAGFVMGLSEWPRTGRALGWLYHSSLPQMVLLVVTLAVLRREGAMHRFLTAGIVAMAMTVGFWWLWPSIGPSAYAEIAPEVARRIGLVVNSAVGAQLRELVAVGPDAIAPMTITGVVAFPSYHMIMALMVAFYARNTPLFPLFVAASLGMIPATLSHGGHHLVDLLAGAAVFGLSALLARRLVPAA